MIIIKMDKQLPACDLASKLVECPQLGPNVSWV